MSPTDRFARRTLRLRARALTITLIYAAFASLWILFSDAALAAVVRDPARLVQLSVVKGIAFVTVTSLLLLLLLRRAFTAIGRGYSELAARGEQLRASEQQLATLLGAATDSILAVDHSGRIAFANAAAERLFEQDAGALSGRSFGELLSRPVPLAPGALSLTRRSKRGETVPLDATVAALPDSTAPGFLVVLRDSTVRRRQAALLAGQRRILEMIAVGEPLSHSLDALVRFLEAQSPGSLCSVLLLDETGTRLRHGAAPSLPPEYVRLIDGEAIGPNAGSCGTAAFRGSAVVVEDIAVDPLWSAYREAALPHGLRSCWSTPIRAKDGRILGTFAIYHRQPARPEPQHQQLIEIATQLAAVAIDRARVEHDLHDVEGRLAAVVEHLGEGLIIADASEATLHLNPAAASLLGVEPDARTIAQARLYELFRLTTMDGHTVAHDAWPLARVRRGDVLQGEEFTLSRRDGAWERVVAFTGRRVAYLDGASIAFLTLRDVTVRTRAQRLLMETQRDLEYKVEERTAALREAVAHAESADRIKSAFLATMSHELRTPLNSIIGFTGIVLRGLAGPLTDEQTKQLSMVRGSAHHLLDLINDVLDISKIEAGQFEVRAQPFALDDAITSVVNTLAPMAERKQLGIVVTAPVELPPIVSDRRRVEQILLNLVNNAIKFTEVGEVRVVVTSVTPPPGTDVAAQPRVRIDIEDTGVGIAADDLPTLFTPFRQLDSGLARQHEGTGLGLAICQRLAHLLGGSITACSTLGVGSRFSVELPLVPTE